MWWSYGKLDCLELRRIGVVTFSCWPTSSGPQDAHRDIQRFRPNSNTVLEQLEDASLGASNFIISNTRRDHVLIHTWHRSSAWTFPPNLGKSYATWTQFFSSNHTIFHWNPYYPLKEHLTRYIQSPTYRRITIYIYINTIQNICTGSNICAVQQP